MDAQRDGAAAKIVAATIARIERNGVEGLTVREIAQDAGVNLAALNYYYRSKDALIAEVLRNRLDHVMTDIDVILARESAAVDERLYELLIYFLNGALDSPHMTRAIFERGAMEGGRAQDLRSKLAEIAERLRLLLGIEDRQAGQARAAQLISAVILPSVIPGFYEGLDALRLAEPEGRAAFIRALMGSPAGAD